MYCGSSWRLGSLTMPERAPVETRYWSGASCFADPLEGGAVAEAVFEGGEWDAAQGKEIVVFELGAVFWVEAHADDAARDGEV